MIAQNRNTELTLRGVLEQEATKLTEVLWHESPSLSYRVRLWFTADTACGDKLPPGFESHDSGADREVEAACLRPDGDPQTVLWIGLEHRAGEPERFAAKHEDVAMSEFGVRVMLRSRLGEEPRLAVGERVDKRVPVVDDVPVEMFPIVESGAAHMLAVELKAQRPDEPKLRAQRDAGASEGTGVVGYLGLIENEMKRRFGHGQILAGRGCETAELSCKNAVPDERCADLPKTLDSPRFRRAFQSEAKNTDVAEPIAT